MHVPERLLNDLGENDDVLGAATEELVGISSGPVTPARVAQRAGYAKATLHAHRPDRLALVRDASVGDGERRGTSPSDEEIAVVVDVVLAGLPELRR